MCPMSRILRFAIAEAREHDGTEAGAQNEGTSTQNGMEIMRAHK